MSPEEIREHAIELILDHARDVEYLSIVESLVGVLDTVDGDDEYEAVCKHIAELIRTATITVEFPASGGDR